MRKEESVQLRMSLQLNKVSIIFQKQEHFEALISSLEVINATITRCIHYYCLSSILKNIKKYLESIYSKFQKYLSILRGIFKKYLNINTKYFKKYLEYFDLNTCQHCLYM